MAEIKYIKVTEMLDMDQAALYLGVALRTLKNWCDDRQITHYKIFGRRKFKKEDLDAYKKANTEERRAVV